MNMSMKSKIRMATGLLVVTNSMVTYAGIATGLTADKMLVIAALWAAMAVVVAINLRRGWL